ncbi:MAG: bifunctional D-glycero-beta-D-manno-heptose-7-phosphate kinase/D-glycero-beta-D-manno-heptose 1-phosphate adenylyltransferase HldE [Gammaproteobacteria bacterium]|nr:MAG: bifunctional D-glycero-beta-D-manno-heptose-7-phosphate kinase/D-glycero-beta-D-manno-heptose 1-phosphate adenylyltransferase HldE [Gammaproteobacteria bacterium]
MKLQIPSFDNARVLIAGDVMLDRYWHGDTSRISPEAPVPVVRVDEIEERPGGAGNVALNIAALGGRPSLMGLTGDDEAADSLQRLLEAAGVDCAFERMPGVPTVTKLRVLSRHQQLIRLDFEEGFAGVDHAGFTDRFESLLQAADVVILSDYGKGALNHSRELIEAARAAGRPVLVDPKSHDFARYRGATLITPNLKEFEAVVGHCPSEEAIVEKGMALIEREQLGGLLVTRSEQGMTLLMAGEAPFHQPTRAREVYDVTGAGDTVISTLAAGLAAGLEMRQAVLLANMAAGIVVGKLGTATVTVPEIRRALHEHDDSLQGVLNEEQLMLAVEDARAHGERIVFTNGCFDILHEGHVAYLEQARRLGDRLIVAVNDDDSVRRLKGDSRPINPLDRRMAVLAGLAAVDWVVPFSEDTPERLICRIRPDLLVKGGDYRPEEIAGHDCVVEAGGEVRILDFLQGCSTTDIVERIRKSEQEVE